MGSSRLTTVILGDVKPEMVFYNAVVPENGSGFSVRHEGKVQKVVPIEKCLICY